MGTPLHVLIVEDSEIDALLLTLELKHGGYEPIHERVETAEAVRAALRNNIWDIILCDYNLPGLNGLEVLAIVKETGSDIPFIIISGAIGEEVAVEAMKAGAHDYIMKDRRQRLLPAVERELREAALRREHRQVEAALRKSEREIPPACRECARCHLRPGRGMSRLSEPGGRPSLRRRIGWGPARHSAAGPCPSRYSRDRPGTDAIAQRGAESGRHR